MRKGYILLITVLMYGCAVVKPKYSKDTRQWQEDIGREDTAKAVSYRLFLPGDMGEVDSEIGRNTLNLLKNKMTASQDSQGVVFLGDNIYPHGIPDSGEAGFKEAAAVLDTYINLLQDYEGDIHFIPGDSDWKKYGSSSLALQDDYLEARLGRKKIFQPDQGCPGPHEADLSEHAKIMIIDSQWYLEDWDKEEDFNSDCDLKDRETFLEELADELGKSRDKRVLLIMHHPMRTYGPHGGQFSFGKTVFPFGAKDSRPFLPIPFLGAFLQKHLGMSQDVSSPRYRELRDKIHGITRGMDNVVLVGAHDHSLQYIEDDKYQYIVSGNGSRSTAAKAGGYAKFTAAQGGFAEVRFFEDRSAWVYYWNSKTGKLDFATEIFPPLPTWDTNFTEYYNLGDSISRPLFPRENYPSKFHISLWGELNRDLYYDTITAPVFRLEDYELGFEPVRRGGGNQTNSLRLIDTTGQTYVLRSVIKDGRRVMGGAFKGTILVDLLRDLFTYGHPFSAFTLAPMAEAAEIYHTKPKLVYVPKQPGLKEFNRTFGGDFYLFEKRADEDMSAIDHFGNSKEVLNWQDALEELQENPTVVMDDDYTIRARLFDLMIGDWDRHQDNWRFATFEEDSLDHKFTLIRPIPRDRDQVYSRFDGPVLRVFNKTFPRARQFQSFEEDVRSMKWYGEFPKFYDRRFIGPIAWDKWEEQIALLQAEVSDSVIEYAVRQMPPPAYARGGKEIVEKIKTRKRNLSDLAREFYLVLAENVEVVGTENDDRFKVVRLNRDSTLVEVYGKTDTTDEVLYYRRYFITNETKEVRLYGLAGDDVFEVEGEVSDGILIRLVGGYDDDSIYDISRVRGWSDKSVAYDHPDGMVLAGGKELEDNTSTRYDFNNYAFKDHQYNWGLALPYATYDPDFGFRAGATFYYHQFGYKRRPEASTHKIKAYYGFGNSSYSISYEGKFYNVMNYWGAILNTHYNGPEFTINYFGLGNETEQFDVEREFYQVRQSEIYFAPGLLRPIGHDAGYFSIQPFYRRLETQQTEDRFISYTNLNDIRQSPVFQPLQFVGAKLGFLYDTRNSFAEPTQGLRNQIQLRHSRSIDMDQNHTSLMGTLAFYQRLDTYDALVWATQFGAEHVFGDYLFFQSAYVGGKSSLRGFREGRFRGRTSFWNSNDIRLNLGKVKNPIIPLDAGIFGSLDVGRVWLDDEESKIWHNTYGGGVFINLLDAMALSLGYHIGDEEGQFLAGLGFNF